MEEQQSFTGKTVLVVDDEKLNRKLIRTILGLRSIEIIEAESAEKALSDLAGGFFYFFLAYLATKYAADIFTDQMTLAYFIITVGLLIIANAVIHFFFHKTKG